MPRSWIIGAVAIAVFVGGYLAGRGSLPNLGKLESERDSANAALADLRQRMADRAARDSARAESLAVVLRRHEQAVQDAKRQARTAGDALAHAVANDTALAALVEKQRASYEAALDADSTTLAATVALYDRRLAARDSTIREQHEAIVTLTRQRDSYRQAARTSLLGKVIRTGAPILATGLVCRLIPGEAQPC